MKKKIKNFRCHICRTVIITDKSTIKCENCGNEYTLKDGKYYRENWITKSYKKFKD